MPENILDNEVILTKLKTGAKSSCPQISSASRRALEEIEKGASPVEFAKGAKAIHDEITLARGAGQGEGMAGKIRENTSEKLPK